KVQVPRRQGRPSRMAKLELRWQEVEMSPPAVALKKSWPALKLYALWARELEAPAGTEPVDWLLLSTWPIKTLKMARRLVRWYSLRWSIECWHKVLKVVCASIQYRSEEHTSKLQSLRHLVCRLLLEKKKKKQNNTTETE